MDLRVTTRDGTAVAFALGHWVWHSPAAVGTDGGVWNRSCCELTPPPPNICRKLEGLPEGGGGLTDRGERVRDEGWPCAEGGHIQGATPPPGPGKASVLAHAVPLRSP